MIKKMKNKLDKLIWDVWINGVGKSILLPRKIRYLVYRIGGLKTNTTNIRSGCTFFRNNIEIGKNSFLNVGVFINGSGNVKIGEHVSLAFGAMVITATHEVGSQNNRAGTTVSYPVEIKDGTWVGARATILPGVTIGEGCVIAAGSVVNKDCYPNGFYAGVPAKRIKDLPIMINRVI